MGEGPDLTGLLQAWSRGDRDALEELAPLLHCELRVMARKLLAMEPRPPGWQATDLVHECFLRLFDWRVPWQNRAHFFGTTARMMRRALVDAARARGAAKRGGGAAHASLDPEELAAPEPQVDLMALDRALESLAAASPRASQVVELRYFGGFTVEETAEALGISVRTVINDWNTARVWLHHQLSSRPALDRSDVDDGDGA